MAAPWRLGCATEAPLPFWGHLPVDAVKRATCRRYALDRAKADDRRYKQKEGEPPRTPTGVSDGTIRREWNVLGAALAYAHAEGYLTASPKATLPPSQRPSSAP